MFLEPNLDSSFAPNRIGFTLYNVTRAINPRKVLELGALNGYSTHVLIQALASINQECELTTVDLFEEYPYNSCSLDQYIKNIGPIASDCDRVRHIIHQLDILSIEDWRPICREPDLVFVDISNDAHKLAKLLPLFNCPVLFEGGTHERDKVSWMTNHNREPIASLSKMDLKYSIIDSRFPGLSLYVP